MIVIRKTYQGFHVSGHAEYAEEGQDIVCSAVSSLALSILLTLQRKKYNLNVVLTKGLIEVTVINQDHLAGVMIDVLFVGGLEIAEQYPAYVMVDLGGYQL